jgi:hypothetical protein
MGHVKKIELFLLLGVVVFLLTYFFGRLFTRRAVKVAKEHEEHPQSPKSPDE